MRVAPRRVLVMRRRPVRAAVWRGGESGALIPTRRGTVARTTYGGVPVAVRAGLRGSIDTAVRRSLSAPVIISRKYRIGRGVDAAMGRLALATPVDRAAGPRSGAGVMDTSARPLPDWFVQVRSMALRFVPMAMRDIHRARWLAYDRTAERGVAARIGRALIMRVRSPIATRGRSGMRAAVSWQRVARVPGRVHGSVLSTTAVGAHVGFSGSIVVVRPIAPVGVVGDGRRVGDTGAIGPVGHGFADDRRVRLMGLVEPTVHRRPDRAVVAEGKPDLPRERAAAVMAPGDVARMMRYLFADEARRPPSGVTGFDDRLSPIFPGRKPGF